MKFTDVINGYLLNNITSTSGVSMYLAALASLTTAIYMYLSSNEEDEQNKIIILNGPGGFAWGYGGPLDLQNALESRGAQVYSYGNGKEPISHDDMNDFFNTLSHELSPITLIINCHGSMSSEIEVETEFGSIMKISSYAPDYFNLTLGDKSESGVAFLSKIKDSLRQSGDTEKPINILLLTCYGGVLASAINYLPIGSSISSLGNNTTLKMSVHETFVQSIYYNPIKNCDLKPASLISEYLMYSSIPAFPIINDAENGLIDFRKIYEMNLLNNNIRKQFSDSEKVTIHKQLAEYIGEEKLNVIIDTIENGNLDKNIGLALVVCHAVNSKIPISFKKNRLKNRDKSCDRSIPKLKDKIQKKPIDYNNSIKFIDVSQVDIHPSFDSYIINNSTQKNLLITAIEFTNKMIENKWNEKHEPQGLIIFGTPGIGKTHLCKTIAHQANKNGLSVLFANPTFINGGQIHDLMNKSDLIILDDFNDVHGEVDLKIALDKIIKGNKNLIIISNAHQTSNSGICRIRRIIFDAIYDNKNLLNNFIIKNYDEKSYRKHWFEYSTKDIINYQEDIINFLTLSPLDYPAGIVLEQKKTNLEEIKSLLVKEGIGENDIKLDEPFRLITINGSTFKERKYYYGEDIDKYNYFIIDINTKDDCMYLIDIIPFMYNYNKKLIISTSNENELLSLIDNTLNSWNGEYQNKESPFRDRFKSMVLTRKSFKLDKMSIDTPQVSQHFPTCEGIQFFNPKIVTDIEPCNTKDAEEILNERKHHFAHHRE